MIREGTTVRDYKVGEQRVYTNFNRIYQATHLITGQESILKISKLRDHTSRLARRERKILKILGGHPNIIRMLDGFRQDGKTCLVLEKIDGIDLNDPREPSRNLRLNAYIIDKVCNGLRYIHSPVHNNGRKNLSLIHGDLSPVNIMVTCEGEVKIIDFAFSGFEKSKTTNDMAYEYGSMNHSPPERIKGEEITTVSDVFSLGTTFYRLIAGRDAFNGNDESFVFNKIRKGRKHTARKFNRRVSKRLDDLLDSAMEIKQENRPDSVVEFQRDLRKMFGGFSGDDKRRVIRYVKRFKK